MTEIKKSIKSIDLASITTIGASINFIGSVIVAIILLIALALITRSLDINIIILLLAMVFTVLIISIPDYFGRTYLFNYLVPKLQEINIKIVDMDKITNISVLPSALMCSTISLIITAIIFPIILVCVALISPVLQILALGGGMWIIYIIFFFSNPLIIAYSFIFTFISVFIATVIFNLVSPKLGGLKVELRREGTMTKLMSIHYLNFALIVGIIAIAIDIVISIIGTIVTMNLVVLLTLLMYLIPGGFGIGFIVGAIVASVYNYLAPRIGELKVKLG